MWKNDLEARVNYYINIICRQKNLPKPQVTPEAIRRLHADDFPGNLQELQEMVDRVLVQPQGRNLHLNCQQLKNTTQIITMKYKSSNFILPFLHQKLHFW